MNGINVVRSRYTKLLTNLALAAMMGLLSSMMPGSCEQEPATVTLVGAQDLAMKAWPATEDGTRSDGPAAAESSDGTLSLDPGCWVLTVDYGPTGQARVANYDHSRPYVGAERDQQHAVCLEAGEAFDLDVGVRWGGFPGSWERMIYFVTPDGDVVANDVTLRVEKVDDQGNSVEEELAVDSGVADLSSISFEFCYRVVAVDHPELTFPGLVGRTTCSAERLPGTTDEQRFSAEFLAVGFPSGQSVDPPQLLLNLESSVVEQVPYDIQIQDNESGETFLLSRSAVGQAVFELPSGCFTVRLIPGPDFMLAEVSRALRYYDVCLDVGDEATIDSGDVVLSNVDGSSPFVPVLAADGAGNPVAGVQVDFFYPRADLAPDDLREIDHSASDSRGVFYDSVATDNDGRALMANYTECMVVTAIAPPGLSFDTGRFQRSTVCEGDSVTLELT